MPRKKITRVLLILTTIMSCLLVMILVALPFLSDTPPVKRIFLKTLSEKSGVKIESDIFQVELFPYPKVEMKNITLTELGSGRQLGTVQGLVFGFQFLPLLSQSVVITHGALVKPVFLVTTDPPQSSTGEGLRFPASMPSQWHIHGLQVSDGQITFIRPSIQGQEKILAWSNIEISIKSGITRLPISVQFAGTLNEKTGPQGFLLTGKIDSQKSTDSYGIPWKNEESDSLHFLGHLDINMLDLRPIMEFIYSPESLSPNWAASGQLHTPIDVVFNRTTWSTTFSNVKAQINDLHIQGKGNVIGETDAPTGVFFQGSTSNITIKALQDLVLPKWLPTDFRTNLLHHQVEGELEVLTATIAGSLEEDEAISAIGALKISEGKGLVFPDLPPLEHISALAVLAPHDQLTVSEILGNYGASKLLSSKFHIAFRKATPEYSADVHIAWDARDAVKTIIHFPQSRAPLTPLLPMEDVHGNGDLDFHLKGPLTTPTQAHIQEAKVKVHQVGIRSQALPLLIKNWSGTVHWKQQELSIQTVAGSIGNSQVEFSGIFSNPESPQLRNGILHAETDMLDIRTLYPDIFQTEDTVSGKMEIVANISGPLNSPQYDSRIDLQNLTLSLPSLLHKPHGVPAWLEFSGTENTPGTFVAHSISLNLPPFALRGKGKLSTKNALAFEGTFQSQSVDENPGASRVVFGGPGFSPDHLDVSLDIQGTSPDWTQWKMVGFLSASETALPTTGDPRAPKEVTIQAKLQDQIVATTFRTEGILSETILEALGNESPPLQGNLSLQGSLNIQTQNQRLATETSTGNFTFRVSSGQVHHITVVSRILGILNLPSLLMGKINLLDDGMPFDQITGTLSLKNGIVNSDDLLMDSPVIKLSAAGNYDVFKDQLNIIVAASPFGAYSEILKSAPLFGKLLKGDRQGLTTAVFKVTGSRQDPEVQYQPLDSLAGGVKGLGQLAVDVLTNFINIPEQALGSTEKKSTLEQEAAPPKRKGKNSNMQRD